MKVSKFLIVIVALFILNIDFAIAEQVIGSTKGALDNKQINISVYLYLLFGLVIFILVFVMYFMFVNMKSDTYSEAESEFNGDELPLHMRTIDSNELPEHWKNKVSSDELPEHYKNKVSSDELPEHWKNKVQWKKRGK